MFLLIYTLLILCLFCKLHHSIALHCTLHDVNRADDDSPPANRSFQQHVSNQLIPSFEDAFAAVVWLLVGPLLCSHQISPHVHYSACIVNYEGLSPRSSNAVPCSTRATGRGWQSSGHEQKQVAPQIQQIRTRNNNNKSKKKDDRAHQRWTRESPGSSPVVHCEPFDFLNPTNSVLISGSTRINTNP